MASTPTPERPTASFTAGATTPAMTSKDSGFTGLTAQPSGAVLAI